MIFNDIETLKIKGRFKWYPNLVCGVDRKIYQLTHFKKRRTCYFREIKYNNKRKGFQIDSTWIPKSRLLHERNYYECFETIEV